MHVILYQPQIPQNTGNIVRTCKVTGTSLSLIPPLGFSTSDKMLKRAGLDYWLGVNVKEEPSLKSFIEKTPHPFYFLSSKATKKYCDVVFTPNDTLIFGSEDKGLPAWVFETYPEKCLTIPMVKGERCLNLSTSVGIVLYEALRQNDFKFDNLLF